MLETFDPAKSKLAPYEFKVMIQRETLLALESEKHKLVMNVFQNSKKTWTASPYNTEDHLFISPKTFPTSKEALDYAIARTLKFIEEGV